MFLQRLGKNIFHANICQQSSQNFLESRWMNYHQNLRSIQHLTLIQKSFNTLIQKYSNSKLTGPWRRHSKTSISQCLDALKEMESLIYNIGNASKTLPKLPDLLLEIKEMEPMQEGLPLRSASKKMLKKRVLYQKRANPKSGYLPNNNNLQFSYILFSFNIHIQVWHW